MESKGNLDPSRDPSTYSLDSQANKIKSKWTVIAAPIVSKDILDHFGKTKVRLPFITGYIVHTRSYNGNTISTIQVNTVQEARLTHVRQSLGDSLK